MADFPVFSTDSPVMINSASSDWVDILVSLRNEVIQFISQNNELTIGVLNGLIDRFIKYYKTLDTSNERFKYGILEVSLRYDYTSNPAITTGEVSLITPYDVTDLDPDNLLFKEQSLHTNYVYNNSDVCLNNVSEHTPYTGVLSQYISPRNTNYNRWVTSVYLSTNGDYSYKNEQDTGYVPIQPRYYFGLNGYYEPNNKIFKFYTSSLNYTGGANPYGKGDSFSGLYPSVSRGGRGSFDDSTDFIDIPNKPNVDTNYGFFSIYKPTPQLVQTISDLLWWKYSSEYSSQSNDLVETIKYSTQWLISNLAVHFLQPFNNIMSLAYIPIDIPEDMMIDAPFVCGPYKFNDCIVKKVVSQIVDFDFGSIVIDEYFGSFLDYNPNTDISIYLPYIGFQNLSLADIMSSTIFLKYRIDLLSGQCIAYLKITKNDNLENGSIPINSVLYQWVGNIKSEIPISSANYDRLRQTLSTIMTINTTALGAGAAGLPSTDSKAGRNAPLTKEEATAGINILGNFGDMFSDMIVGNGLSNPVPHGHAMTNENGLLGIQKAFVMIHRPIQSLQKIYDRDFGFPCNITTKLSELKGFVQVQRPHITINAIIEEINMIEQCLIGGVII